MTLREALAATEGMSRRLTLYTFVPAPDDAWKSTIRVVAKSPAQAWLLVGEEVGRCHPMPRSLTLLTEEPVEVPE